MSQSAFIRFKGDNVRFLLYLTQPDTGAVFDPTGYQLIFTLKANPADADSAAIVQKYSIIGGITVISATDGEIAVDLVPADWTSLTPGRNYFYDVRAQRVSDGFLYTVFFGDFAPRWNVTRTFTLSIPTYTTTPAALFAWAANYVPPAGPRSSSGYAGTTGQWSYDTNFLYFCVATNTWRAAALSDYAQ